MSLRDQPYLPLYVKDFMTDERLNECSAESAGVYIRIMCLMHKSDPYGKILLRQKDRQSDRQISNFAAKLAKQMPYSIEVIERSLEELLEEEVLTIDGDVLYQRRMVRDEEISAKRASAGKKGAEKTNARSSFADGFADEFAAAKTSANTANANANENYKEKEGLNEISGRGESDSKPPVILLPLNDGTEYPVTEEQCQEWAGLYPAVDVAQQLRGMRGWLITNPTKRKTKRGIARFINSWLAREQDKGGRRSPPTEPPPVPLVPQERRPDKPIDYDPSKSWEDYVT